MADEALRERINNRDLIHARIKAWYDSEGLSPKEFSARTGIGLWSAYKKLPAGPWTGADLVKIGRAAGAPTLWPLLDWSEAKRIDDQFFDAPPPKSRRGR